MDSNIWIIFMYKHGLIFYRVKKHYAETSMLNLYLWNKLNTIQGQEHWRLSPSKRGNRSAKKLYIYQLTFFYALQNKELKYICMTEIYSIFCNKLYRKEKIIQKIF